MPPLQKTLAPDLAVEACVTMALGIELRDWKPNGTPEDEVWVLGSLGVLQAIVNNGSLLPAVRMHAITLYCATRNLWLRTYRGGRLQRSIPPVP